MRTKWAGVHQCQERNWDDGGYCVAPATELQLRIYHDGRSFPWLSCVDHAPVGRAHDVDAITLEHAVAHLYLPIVQPVMGSEPAIALEIALTAACRLLRLGDCDRMDSRGVEARADLELLRKAQAEAWLRRKVAA